MRLPWPLDVLSPDYHHLSHLDLARQQRNEVFIVTPDLIETMLTANSFAPHMFNGKLVVVVRGAKLVSPEQGVQGVVTELKDMRPDHRQPQSVVIVYDRNAPSLAAFTASTVPSQLFIERSITHGGQGANLMPTGSYNFVVRPFFNGGATRPGNIMMDTEDFFVVRRTRNPTYEIIDDVSLSQPRNGILPSFRPLSDFQSAGSIHLSGSQNRERPYDFRGAFLEFRTELGLSHPPDGSDHGKQIGVVILTGLDLATGARLLQQGIGLGDKDFESHLRRLRFGSVGEYVENLQRELGLKVTGSLGPATFRRLSELQFESLGWWDGILSPEAEEKLELQVFPTNDESSIGDSSNSQTD